MGLSIIILLLLSLGLMALAVKYQEEAGLAFGLLSFYGLAITALLFLIWVFKKVINKRAKSYGMKLNKQRNVELILLGTGCIMFFYAGLVYRYATIIGLGITLAGCYLWTKRKNKLGAFRFMDSLGPLIVFLGSIIVFYSFGGIFLRNQHMFETIIGVCAFLIGCFLWTRSKNRSWVLKFWEILGPMLILLAIGSFMSVYSGAFPVSNIIIVGICTILAGCFLWTKRKNRSWVFTLWGILGSIGFLGIALLEDKTVTNDTTEVPSQSTS